MEEADRDSQQNGLMRLDIRIYNAHVGNKRREYKTRTAKKRKQSRKKRRRRAGLVEPRVICLSIRETAAADAEGFFFY